MGADSVADSDFVDNDYEIDIDDDDLFAQNVDGMLINEEANCNTPGVMSLLSTKI